MSNLNSTEGNSPKERAERVRLAAYKRAFETTPVPLDVISTEGVRFSPKSRYLKFDRFTPTSDGGKVFDPLTPGARRTRDKVKLTKPVAAELHGQILLAAEIEQEG